MAWEQEQEIAFLKQATGVADLGQAVSVQMTVDTKANAVSYIGDRMPNLYELKLCSSSIGSLRDLGTALRRLSVLWITRCELTHLVRKQWPDAVLILLNATALLQACACVPVCRCCCRER